MAAIDTTALLARANEYSALSKRNFASKEPGVIVVFVLVFIVGVSLVGLFIWKKVAAARGAKPAF